MKIVLFGMFLNQVRRPQAGVRLVYRNHFHTDVSMCVYMDACVYAPEAMNN